MKESKRKISQREVDVLTGDINSWWGKTFVFIKKNKIRTWKGVFILAFCAGLATATIWLVSFNIQSSSDAAMGASLSLWVDDKAITLENGSNIVDMKVLLNSHSNKVVAVKAIINYNPTYFSLESWDTTSSIFALNNACSYNNKPCEIINNDQANGKITITVAKPTPGVNTDSGVVALLKFKAKERVTASSRNFTLNYTSSGNYNDSDVILDDGNGTDILSSVEGATISVYTAICNSFEYSAWSVCQPDSTQSRTVSASLPNGCYGGNPVLEQSCDYTSSVACTSVSYSDWGICQPNDTQSRTVTVKTPANCTDGNLILTRTCAYTPPACSIVYSSWGACQLNGKQTRTVASSGPSGCEANDLILEQDCDYNAPTCVDFTYSAWKDCQPDSKQSRTIVSSLPAGCAGGTPVTEQNCTYQTGTASCADFTYSDWGDCQSNGKKYRTVTTSSPEKCSGGNPITEQGCKFTPPTCEEFKYSDWGKCQPNGFQYRTTTSSSPSGCSGGTLKLSQSCRYSSGGDSSGGSGGGNDDKKSKDKEDPKFANMPAFLRKNRGDMVWWEATDNKGIDHYTLNFDGKKDTTKKTNFRVPITTRRGFHMLRIKAFDKAGNSKSRMISIWVR